MYHDILKFWFEDISPATWWAVDTEFDARVTKHFLSVLTQAAKGELFEWRKEPQGRLAEIIVLDQFPRNIYRGTAAAFTQDTSALILAQEAVQAGVLDALVPNQRPFLLMPYMHSESRKIHTIAEGLFRKYAPNNFDFEVRHKAIIDRFGRYPHRNNILGRHVASSHHF